MRNGGNKPIQVIEVSNGQAETVSAEIIVENPVSLTVNGEVWLSLMCTPVDLEALAVGFLFNEGLIKAYSEVASIRVCPTQDNVDVWLYHAVSKPKNWRRTSGCTGGVTSLISESVEANPEKGLPAFYLTPSQVSHLVMQLFDSQDLYRRSGGVHTSALSDGERLLVVTEDIGRHNTLDKIAGRCLIEGVEAKQKVLMTTGRISSEMLQKAARLGAAVVISRTSPSSLSIEMAEKWGITLIGYARRNHFNIYAHPERITSDNQSDRFPSFSQNMDIKS